MGIAFACLVALVASSALANHEPEVYELFWVVPGHESPEHAIPHHARGVKLRPGVLGQSRFTIELFEHEQITAVRTRREIRKGGSHTWIGEVEGYPGSHVSLTSHKGRIAGSILFGERQFEISSGPHGSTFFEVDTHELPPIPSPVDPEVGGDGGSPPTSQAAFTHDVLALYTPASLARYGQAGIETKILDAIASANQAYQNSKIDLQLSLVHMAEVNYTETGDMGVALERLQRTSDGWMDEVHALRNQVGADLVALIDEDSNYCGIAYVMTNESTGFAGWAFSVTYSSCLSSQTLAHEIGHNQGDAHDRANSNVAGVFAYSYGHRRCAQDGTGFRTVMSYSCSGASRIQYFSNPDVSWNGFPTGIDHAVDPANSADNARSMNQVADTVAAFRASVTATPPAAPNGLSASAAAWDVIDLAWADQSGDEAGFRVERSSDGSSYSEIASLPANISGYSDTGLDASTTYWYRVYAHNSAGNSGYSNVASDTTPPPPPPPAAPANLGATALSSTQIQLDWDDVSNEDGYDVERSPDGASWSPLTSLSAGQTTFTDSGLAAASTWSYRVRAFNGSGASGPSNVATTTTTSFEYVFADGESAIYGTTTGSYPNTWEADGSVQTIQETTTGGKKSRRKSRLEHVWSFDVPPANAATLFVTAWRNGGGPDDFSFEVSADGGASWLPLVGLSDGSPLQQAAPCPPGLSGPMQLRVIDTDRGTGETILDSVHVDELYILAESDPTAAPPAAPTGLAAQALGSSHVALSWTDQADDELGFEIERSQNGSTWIGVGNAPADATGFDDLTAAPSTTYTYRVRAFNGAGASADAVSNPVTTQQGAALSLSASGYKRKGTRYADLAWSGAGTGSVEVRRDGALVATVPNSGSYTDAIPGKGGGSFVYQVCETGGGSCSNSANVVF
jgi:hypothetical protein